MSEANREAAEQWAGRAAAALKDGNLADAAKYCEKSLRLNPDDPRVQSLRDRVAAALAGEVPSSPGSASAASPQRSSAGAEASHRGTDGLRGSGRPSAPPAASQRTAAAAPAPAAGAGAAGPSVRSRVSDTAPRAAPPAAVRPHTPEQAAAVRSIKVAADYYAVLGVSKDASPEDIKRGYKKQAQKVHPDKCPAPGADDAFKRVGAAFSILSDPEKRAHYDRFGGDEESVSRGAGGGGGGRDYARQQHYARYEDEISPEEIFNMFFGGGSPLGGGIRMRGGFRRTPEQHYRAQQAAAHEQGGGGQHAGGARFAQLLQLLPLLLLFLFSVLSFRGGADEKLYGLARDDVFRTERKTSLSSVTSGLPYYVKDDFWSRVSADRSLLTRVERSVESELYSTLSSACTAESQRRAAIENQLKYASSAARERLKQRLEEARVPSCEKFERYFGR